MAYTDSDNAYERMLEFIEKLKEYNLSCTGFYLSSGYTSIGNDRCVFNWNYNKFPNPGAFVETFKENGIEIIPNIKPAFLQRHPMYEKLKDKGLFIKNPNGTPFVTQFWDGLGSYLDFTNPGAYDFWKACVKTQLVEKGYRHIWNDNNEYDVQDEAVKAYGFGCPVPAVRIRPLFSYLMARASREACEQAGVREPFNVSRCAIAGTQRVASTWTGDNFTSFDELRWNHKQIMTMALSGFWFFGPDIGGFAGPKPSEELFLRWLQYGVFLPRLTLHSW
jgi:alpha-glucosidase